MLVIKGSWSSNGVIVCLYVLSFQYILSLSSRLFTIFESANHKENKSVALSMILNFIILVVVRMTQVYQENCEAFCTLKTIF